jgi:cytochrome c-type biogenesis protein CcmH/NrfG
MMFVLLAAAAMLAVGFVLWPFVRQAVPAMPGGDSTSDTGEELRLQQASLYEAIRELDFTYQAGQYSEEDYQRQRLDYEHQAAAVLQALDQQQHAVTSSPRASSPRQQTTGRARWLRWGLVIGVLALSGLGWGYWLSIATSPKPPDVSAMLAAADATLERGNMSDALLQYRAVLEQAPGNVTVLTRLAILAQQAGQPANGLRLIKDALKQQPRYVPAWQAKGFLHFSQKDYQEAIAAWETYLRLASNNDPHRKSIEALITQSRQRAQAAQTADMAPADVAPATISGTLRLAAEPSPPIPAGAVLFIIAGSGTGPPVAVKRIRGPQFPLDYNLGMEDVMLHGRAFTGTVNVSVRLQATGMIGPVQPGDLVGRYPGNPVAVGATGVDIMLEQQR